VKEDSQQADYGSCRHARSLLLLKESAAKKRKRRKNGNNEAKDGSGTASLPSLAQGVFADLKFSRAKVHQKAVLNSRCPYVADKSFLCT
jgi:hypothetical protein